MGCLFLASFIFHFEVTSLRLPLGFLAAAEESLRKLSVLVGQKVVPFGQIAWP